MIKQHQLYRHEPHNGIYGDCLRTALACLFDLPAHEVPHFYQHQVEREGYVAHVQVGMWLAERGMAQVISHWDGEFHSLDWVLGMQRVNNPDAYYMLGGTSPRGFNHGVIGRGGRIEWDPHPDGTGLVAPLNTGFWEITYFVPLSLMAVSP